MYIHVPFCTRRCVYCDFAIKVARRPAGDRWMGAIRKEFETLRASGDVPLAPALETIYVGGGTPSVLEPRFVGGVADVLGRERIRGTDIEWTVEANPESFTSSVARAWAALGVNRVSFGVQSFDPGALAWMGRLHSAADAEKAVGRARDVGVTNLSIDLIFGLPESVSRCWEEDLAHALELAVPHISLYGLEVEKGTPLFRNVAEGRTPRPSEARFQEEYLYASEALASAGYEHYEVASFAHRGFSSRHNRAYWEGTSYLGLGNGAHSYHADRRWWNEREWDAYAERVARTGSGRSSSEILSPEQARLESLWLGLRTSQGVRTVPLGASVARVVRSWEVRGLARLDGTRVRLTPAGWLVLDELTLELEAVRQDIP